MLHIRSIINKNAASMGKINKNAAAMGTIRAPIMHRKSILIIRGKILMQRAETVHRKMPRGTKTNIVRNTRWHLERKSRARSREGQL
mmetsp:Transcript_18074/g.26840  ORF Transcript_18074/g.26840 Transcript_18074/m.26840 type:complete len:87 (-) Transcript_18074:1137-1397(-)